MRITDFRNLPTIPSEASLTPFFSRQLDWTLHARQIIDMLQAIERQTTPLVDGVQGKRSLELITAIYKSAITRSVVSAPYPPR